MKIMIRCDMEGVTGVTRFDQADPGRAEYPFARQMLMNDLQATTAGLFAGGAEAISIYDMHYFGTNVVAGALDERVTVIGEKPIYTTESAGGLDSTFAGLVLLGLHSKAGTPNGLLAHSYELETRDIKINGRSVGEIGVEAAVAGDFGVPVILVTGDSKGTEEARALLRDVETAVVKESFGPEAGRCLPPDETAKRIREAAIRAASQLKRFTPFVVAGPVEMGITLAPGPFRDRVAKRAGRSFVSGEQLVLKGDSVTEVWAKYRQWVHQ